MSVVIYWILLFYVLNKIDKVFFVLIQNKTITVLIIDATGRSSSNTSTVKPVLRGHLWDKVKVTL
jgi:hypothetical protein